MFQIVEKIVNSQDQVDSIKSNVLQEQTNEAGPDVAVAISDKQETSCSPKKQLLIQPRTSNLFLTKENEIISANSINQSDDAVVAKEQDVVASKQAISSPKQRSELILREDQVIYSNTIIQSSNNLKVDKQIQTDLQAEDEIENVDLDDNDESSQVNTPFHFKPDIKYYQVKGKYSIEFLKCIENNPAKIESFYQNVIPALAYQVYYKLENKVKHVCMFSSCKRVNKSFAEKQSYIRHVISTHYNDLPGGGAFLMPRAKKFKCNMCKMSFNGYESLVRHANKCTGADLHDDESLESNSTSNSSTSNSSTNSKLSPNLISLANAKLNRMKLASNNIDDFADEIEIINQTISTNSNEKKESKGLKRDLSSYSVCGADEKKSKDDENEYEGDDSMDESN